MRGASPAPCALLLVFRCHLSQRSGAEELFADYCRADLWHVVGAQLQPVPSPCIRSVFVSSLVALRIPARPVHSGICSRRKWGAASAELASAAGQGSWQQVRIQISKHLPSARLGSRCRRSHLLDKCGHWLHVDNPDGARAPHCLPQPS